MATRGQQPQGAIVPGTADHFGALVVNSGKNFVKTHPRISIAWVVGLLISILASGFTPSQEAVQKYEVKLADLDDRSLEEAHGNVLYWEDRYRRSRGWFWSCNDHCQYNKQMFQESRKAFDGIHREYRRGLAEAKSQLGLFSEDGVAEARELFWSKVAGGKQFAQRATMWDTMYYMTFGSFRRDEGIAAIILKVLFRFVVNLTMGLIMAVIQFLFSIWQVIWSYQPDPLSTAAFFAMAALGAVSLLITWFLGLAAVGVVGVYTVAKAAENAQIEAQAQGRGGGYYMHNQQQQHQQQHPQGWSQDQHQQQARQRRPGTSQPQSSNWEHID